jgi:hypothetical protein
MLLILSKSAVLLVTNVKLCFSQPFRLLCNRQNDLKAFVSLCWVCFLRVLLNAYFRGFAEISLDMNKNVNIFFKI